VLEYLKKKSSLLPMKEAFLPKVSVLISVFNNEKTLDRCLESIFSQSYRDFEVVCVNDGSSDTSLEIIGRWAEKIGPDRFFLIKNSENIGLTKSLNLAIEKARGEYMARIDADDFWNKTKLEQQVAFLESHPEVGILGCNFANVYKNGKEKYFTTDETDAAIRKNIFKKNPFSHSCVVARLDLVRKTGGYDEAIRYGQDYELWLRCLPFTKFHNLQEFLCTRIIGTGNSLKKQKQQMSQNMKTKLKYIRKYRYGLTNYAYLIEPLIIYLTPEALKKIKRKFI